MGDFVNGVGNKIVAILLSIVVIAINLFFVTNVVGEMELSAGYIAIVGKANNSPNFDTFNKFDLFRSHFRCTLSWLCCLSRNSHVLFNGSNWTC